MRKLAIIFTVLTLVISSLFSIGTEKKVYASMNEAKRIEITIISDEIDHKVIELSSKNEDSIHSLEITKNQDGTHSFTTKFLSSEEVIYVNTLEIINISDEFNTNEWVQSISQQLNGDNESLQNFYNKNINFKEESNNSDVEPLALPLVAAFAIGGLSAAQIATLQTALYATVATVIAAASLDILNEKKNSSTVTGPVTSTQESFSKAAEFSGVPTNLTTSGQKHMEAALTIAIAEQIKNNSNNSNNNLEVYVSSLNTTQLKSNVMVVYDIKTNVSGKVNRHLGNVLGGTKADSTYPDVTMNLNGYTVFMIYNHSSKKLFHAHFVPTMDRSKELLYQRYRGQFDLKVFPSVSSNSTFLENKNRPEFDQIQWEKNYMNALNGRNLLKDSKNRKSVVPTK